MFNLDGERRPVSNIEGSSMDKENTLSLHRRKTWYEDGYCGQTVCLGQARTVKY